MNKRGAWVALLALVTALANPAPVRAMHPLDKVQALLQSPAVTVDEDTAWRYRILALLAPDRLPVSLQGEGTTRMATLVRAELVDAYPTLGDANKALLAELGWGLRPGPGGRGASTRLSYANGQTVDITSSVGTVRIHYTLDTQDPHATNQNYLDTLVSVVNTALQTEVLTLGYPMPPSDGDGIYDVYLEDQDNIYGYVQPEGGLTDNPNTTQVENSARTSHMVMENDMAEAVFKSTTQEALELNVKVTFAHEFFHAIQFGLAASFSDQTSWLLESTAVWMEITVYPGNNATYNEYSLDWMRYPDAGLIGTDGSLGIPGTHPP